MSRKNDSTLKGLKAQLDKKRGELESKKLQLSDLTDEILKEKQRIGNLIKTIGDLECKEIVISDHAMLRYLERIYELDLEMVKGQILTNEALSIIEQFGGNGKYQLKDFTLVLKNNTIVTITN